jgi:uncharacterized membrane protein YidH (DUF202 family)
MRDGARILASIVSLMLLALAFYAYIQAFNLLRERNDWMNYMHNIIVSCMLLLLFILIVLVVLVLVTVVIGRE